MISGKKGPLAPTWCPSPTPRFFSHLATTLFSMDPGKELPAGSRGAGNTHSLPTSNAASLVATEVDGLSSSTDGQSYLVKPFKSPPSGYGPTTSNYKPLDNDALNHMGESALPIAILRPLPFLILSLHLRPSFPRLMNQSPTPTKAK